MKLRGLTQPLARSWVSSHPAASKNLFKSLEIFLRSSGFAFLDDYFKILIRRSGGIYRSPPEAGLSI